MYTVALCALMFMTRYTSGVKFGILGERYYRKVCCITIVTITFCKKKKLYLCTEDEFSSADLNYSILAHGRQVSYCEVNH